MVGNSPQRIPELTQCRDHMPPPPPPAAFSLEGTDRKTLSDRLQVEFIISLT